MPALRGVVEMCANRACCNAVSGSALLDGLPLPHARPVVEAGRPQVHTNSQKIRVTPNAGLRRHSGGFVIHRTPRHAVHVAPVASVALCPLDPPSFEKQVDRPDHGGFVHPQLFGDGNRTTCGTSTNKPESIDLDQDAPLTSADLPIGNQFEPIDLNPPTRWLGGVAMSACERSWHGR